MHRSAIPLLAMAALLAGCSAGPAAAQPQGGGSAGPSHVQVAHPGNDYQLLVNGKPFLVKGSGGDGSLDRLKATGANALRTWGADKLDTILPEARQHGLMVTAGIWLGHQEQGFNWHDPDQVAKQKENVRQIVLKYRNDPGLLIWALGNEMEGYSNGDDVTIWRSIEDLARMVKQLDPNHPTMTVLSEIGGERVKDVNAYCPDIDIVGINSYGGSTSLAQRYKAAGGAKPYIITEYGPPGTWETGKTSWGAPYEMTSTEKANWFREAYQKSIAGQPLCLGGFAFVWGHKQEGTATWNGLLLPDGAKLGAVDVLHQLWTGNPPANPCPTIQSLKLDGSDMVAPGATIHARLDAAAPTGAPLKTTWVLMDEDLFKNVGGVAEDALHTYPDAVVRSGQADADIKLPEKPGKYRLYVTVEDGKGDAATANVPLLAQAKTAAAGPPAPTARLPLSLFPAQGGAPYIASGWMGDAKSIQMDDHCLQNPHSGSSCLEFRFNQNDGWGGVVWQSPADDWGDKPGGWNLTGAKKLTFWARGDKGGEVVAFQFGLLGMDKKYGDTAQGKLDKVTLTPAWKQYAIDLTGKDLSRVKTGFCWVVAGQGAPVTFYLDDIRYE